jgi:hypothetical protein
MVVSFFQLIVTLLLFVCVFILLTLTSTLNNFYGTAILNYHVFETL